MEKAIKKNVVSIIVFGIFCLLALGSVSSDEELKQSQVNYNIAVTEFNNKNYDKAEELFKSVEVDDEKNYDLAKQKLSEIYVIKTQIAEENRKKETESEKKQSEKTLNEPWTKDNMVEKLRLMNVLDGKGVFTDNTHGLGVVDIKDNYGETNIKIPTCLILSIEPTEGDLKDLSVMKEITFNIVEAIHNNYKKMGFNIALLELHYHNKSTKKGVANGDNFFIGINTIENYFKKPRSEMVGIDSTTGETKHIDFDADSFYKWIESNFTQPEDNSVLVENESWASTSEKGNLN